MNKVAAFYEFLRLPRPEAVREEFLARCDALGLFGTVLVSPEGINGTLAGAPENIDAFVAFLRQETGVRPAFARLELKFSTAGAKHFDRLKIRVKREIITFGQVLDPARPVGRYVPAHDWNGLLADPNVLLVDTRNGFEVAMGTFTDAVDPGLTSFSDFKRFVDTQLGDAAKSRKIALFCTGGIRCEKASAYMIDAGFREVYQLEGGILRYLEEIPEEESMWQGDCFVFDQRLALGHGLTLKTSNDHANYLDTTPGSNAE
jgi:UPF0176 protein